MASSHVPYIPLLMVIGLGIIMGLAILVLNSILGPKRPNARKSAPFECGNEPAGVVRQRFDVKFYLVALFFIIFDIEVVFLFPWAVQFREQLINGNGLLFFGEMLAFLGLLTLGLVYVWKRGALDWE